MKTKDTVQLIKEATGKTVEPAAVRVLEQIISQGDKFEQMGHSDGFCRRRSIAEKVGLTLAKRTALNDIAFSNEVSAYMKMRYLAGYEAGKVERYGKR